MATEELAPGIHRIDAIGLSNRVSVLAFSAADGWTLVDTGIGGSPKRIQAALSALGVGPQELARIYLTHHHPDHVGGLPAIRAWAPSAEIITSEHEAEILRGNQPPDPSSNEVFRFLQRFAKVAVGAVGRTVAEGDLVGGFRVVATPGHTRGHTSLISDEHGILFTGDAFGALPRRIRVGVRSFLCNDPAAAKRSAEKLLEARYETVVFSHGEVWRVGAKDRLRRVVAECG